MPDTEFGELIAFSDAEDKVLLHYKTWMHTWLCARERKLGMTVGTISRPRSYIVKQTFAALPGEETTPLVIAVSDGFAAEPARRGNGDWDAYLRFGIAVMCSGHEGAARALCGHYQTAIVGIATRHRSIDDGAVQFADWGNLRIEDVDEEAVGRSLCAVRMEVIYKVPNFAGERPAPPLEPPIDPEDPQPDDPEVQDVIINVNNYLVDEEIPSGP